MFTYDSPYQIFNRNGDQAGKSFGTRYKVMDSKSGRSKWYDSTGAFMVGELERLDQTLNEPLASIFFGRDIDLREDVTIADEVSSFTVMTFGSASGFGAGQGIGNGKSWVKKNTTQISGVDVDLAKLTYQLHEWALELKYTIFELESAARIGRPVDEQKYAAMQLKHQMDCDEMAYIGDTSLKTASGAAVTGLINNILVTTVQLLPVGAGGSTNWGQKTPDEILADFNLALTTVWQNSAYAVIPSKVLLPPKQYGYIATQKVSLAGNESIKSYIERNNLLSTNGGGRLQIEPTKWAIGAGAVGTLGTYSIDRMTVYTKDKKYVRFPLTMLQRTPVQFDGLFHKTTYFCRIGEVEVVYPETVGYFDGL